MVSRLPQLRVDPTTRTGLTESGASKQVRRLVDAGLVRQRRQGWYVLHELDAERAAALSGELLAFLREGGVDGS